MWTVMTKPVHVIVGPLEAATAYARHRGWKTDEFRIVTEAEELHRLDPPSIRGIFMVKARRLGRAVYIALQHEIESLTALWTVPVLAIAR